MICEMSDKLRASLKEVYKIPDPWEGMGDTSSNRKKSNMIS